MSAVTRSLFATLFPLVAACEDMLSPDPALEGAGKTSAAIAAPTLTASPLSSQEINLSWTDNVLGETGWEIQRSPGTAAFTVVVNVGANATKYTDHHGLTPGMKYCYRVRAFKRKRLRTTFHPLSNESCTTTPAVTPPPPPPGPTTLRATILDGVHWLRGITLSWFDPDTRRTAFVIERASSEGGPWTFVVELAPHYESRNIYDSPEEQQVCFRVLTRHDQVLSSPSPTACTSFPAAPSGLSASPSGSAIALAWTDNSAVEDGYLLERSDGPSQGIITFATLVTLPANASGYEDRSVERERTYHYRVWAVREGARASMSNAVIAGILTRAPLAPSINAYPGSSSVVHTSVTPSSPDGQGFRFERSADGVSGWTTYGTNTNPALSDYGLQSEVRVCYRAFAFNSVGESPPSNVDCVTPPAAPSEVLALSPNDGQYHVTWRDNSNVEDGYEVWWQFCDWDDCRGVSIVLPPNTTEWVTDGPILGVRATKDGGHSDWVAAAAASVQGRRTARPRR